MSTRYDIAGYCRISVDTEAGKDNTSIENQKDIIADFVKRRFPDSTLTFYEDRDQSGYTFSQREGYQKMRRELMAHKKDILIIKDFSRFSRRNGAGIVELEYLRDAGVRIISVDDGIDFPNDDAWERIQLFFFLNEMPVTNASKKVKSVIKHRQEEGKWICAAPYGYVINKQQQFEIVPEEAEIVRKIYDLYNSGWGYKKIADYLTDANIPTPRMSEKARKEAEGDNYRRSVKPVWAIATVQGILDDDFYIGTLRQGKYTRVKINGRCRSKDEAEQIVIERHHKEIVDFHTFASVRALRENRSTSHYRGQKKYDNVYSGFLECGDCGSPMFAMSRADLKDAYRCGTYHRRGLKACTSHHIRVDKLDELIKEYVRMVKDNSASMLERLNTELKAEENDITEAEQSVDNLEAKIEYLKKELIATKQDRIRENVKHPELADLTNEIYDKMEGDLAKQISGLNNQISLISDKRNTIIRVNRAAKTAMDVFDDILNKPKLEKADLQLIIEKIKVYEDHIEVDLKPDIDALLSSGKLPQEIPEFQIIQKSDNHNSKIYSINVINNGDPLEIYTEKDGEVIFKKYSPMGELGDYAAAMCETLGRAAGMPVAIADRDAVIAVSGVPKRELLSKPLSADLEGVMELRQVYTRKKGESGVRLSDAAEKYSVTVSAPILTEGELMGSVIFFTDGDGGAGEVETKLAQTVAGFLGKQMES